MLVIGIGMFVSPGPAFIMIPAGLAILTIDLAWARCWLRSVREINRDFFSEANSVAIVKWNRELNEVQQGQ